VSSQGIACAIARHQVCHHRVLRVPSQGIGVSQGIGCAATMYQLCHHRVLRVPSQGIGVSQGIGCAATMYQVCHHRVLRVPSQGIRCVTRYRVCRRNVSGVPRIFVRHSQVIVIKGNMLNETIKQQVYTIRSNVCLCTFVITIYLHPSTVTDIHTIVKVIHSKYLYIYTYLLSCIISYLIFERRNYVVRYYISGKFGEGGVQNLGNIALQFVGIESDSHVCGNF
jgi:hypothetical protein